MKVQPVFTLLNALFWTITYPLLLVVYWIVILLSWIASPLIYLGRFFVQAGLVPLRFLAKFETLYIYFGVAIIVGLTTGLILHVLSRTSSHILGLDTHVPEVEKKAKGHTAASYRASREKKKKLDKELTNATKARLHALNPLLREAFQHSPGGRASMPQSPNTPKRREGLLSTTILEEVEDSDGDFDF